MDVINKAVMQNNEAVILPQTFSGNLADIQLCIFQFPSTKGCLC